MSSVRESAAPPHDPGPVRPRPTGSSTTTACVAVALFLVVFCNASFWAAAFSSSPSSATARVLFLASLFVFLWALLTVLLALFVHKHVFKPAAILLLLSAAVMSYYMDTYGVVMDATMIQNILETDTHEVAELINLRLIYRVFLFGLVPAFLLARWRLHYRKLGRQLLANAALILICIVVLVANVFIFRKEYVSLARDVPQFRSLINPANLLFGAGANARRLLERNSGPLVPLGEDAVLQAPWQERGKRTLVIFVLGETARAQQFSLNGYERETNPLLAREDIVNFTRVESCGTATATSLPCIFSPLGRESFDRSDARRTENLLDVIARAGVRVLWRDNNSGCKGICDRVESEDMVDLDVPGDCTALECYDTVLLHDLDRWVDSLEGDGLVVLHQSGSHGPAYYLRHPPEFTTFRPECMSSQLESCSREEIVNAYDNTILYTDFFLEQVIEFLRGKEAEFNGAMLYASDHGESLGENGIFLHGLPYRIAPEEQTHIPFLLWFSDGFAQEAGIHLPCLMALRDQPRSHENIFHSLLGMMGVRTALYDAGLDLTAECRRAAEPFLR